MDYREALFQELSRGLVCLGYDGEAVKRINRMMIQRMSKYKIEPQSTELALPNTRDEQLLKAYIAAIVTEGKSKKTGYVYYRVLSSFQADVDKPLCDVTVFDIRTWLAQLESRVSLVTCRNYRSYLCAFYTWLYNEDIISKNPIAKVKPIKCEKQVKLPFSVVAVDKLRNACTTLRQRAVLEFLLSSGVRVSECAAMNIGDIDWQNGKVLVREGKGNKQRTVFIDDVCKAHLQSYLLARADNLPALFLTRYDTRISAQDIRKELKVLGKQANVECVHPHRCRRTFATNLAKRGMDVQDIRVLMGHADINTTMKYIHLDCATIENAYRRCI